MARRIAQSSINWTAIAERVPPAQKTNFIAFKSKSDKYLRSVLANPEAPPKIDWAVYKNKVPIAGMVDSFQKQYESMKVPYPADTTSAQVDQQKEQVTKQIKQFVADSQTRIAEHEKAIAHLKSLLPFNQMTMEDFKDAFPEAALDPLNNPTFFPHTDDEQPHPDDDKKPTEHH
ncbi:CLUMA_CG005332, isoform A [Clunio marinus]|uniref:ATP synthase subunit d, mitochondrial n=1 Tax=Clunio marinus TaxID=568069 RepID=A0A1J1HWE5_9DIPT|nr:CLUMA_CG005332, isoform A [Clunio marinus]